MGRKSLLRLLLARHDQGVTRLRDIGLARLTAAGGAALLGLVVARIGLDDVAVRSSPGRVALTLTVGWSFVASGLVAWRRRPENRIGVVMVATGYLRLIVDLDAAQNSLLFTVGHSLNVAFGAGIAYILLAFPDGRLTGVAERVILGVLVVAAVPMSVTWFALGGHHGICDRCPDNLIAIADGDGVAEPLHTVMITTAAVGAIGAAGVLAHRWRHATPRLRFAIAPVLWVGAAAFLAIGAWTTTMIVWGMPFEFPDILLELVFAAIPIAFLVGVGRTRIARSAVADLVIELGHTPPPRELRDALARALRDPTLEVAYWLPEAERYVDANGTPVRLPEGDAARAVTVVEHGGGCVAALVHDPALCDDEPLVESACAAAGLALANGRLQAELQARLTDLAASRARIVEAEEAERRRIERDLHDGAQQRLVSIAMTLGLAEARASNGGDTVSLVREARTSLSLALDELRELSQGIHPSILTERGLPGALDDLASRARPPVRLEVSLPTRLAEHVETAAYYVVAEALTNVAKHAAATTVTVRATLRSGCVCVTVADDGTGGADEADGSGLKGLRDRVEAIGGRLTVTSQPGNGTTLHAELPCAS